MWRGDFGNNISDSSFSSIFSSSFSSSFHLFLFFFLSHLPFLLYFLAISLVQLLRHLCNESIMVAWICLSFFYVNVGACWRILIRLGF